MFSQAEKDAFASKQIFEFYKVVAEYRFYIQLGEDAELIRIRIEEDPHGRFHFAQSHYIQTPEQAGPYVTSRNIEDRADIALSRAVETITADLEAAIANGHTPSAKWLVKCSTFDAN